MSEPVVRVGVGVILLNAKTEILCIKRANTHGQGTWAIPGGHLNHGESFEECAIREIKEETGLDMIHVETLGVANHIFDNGKHYISIYLIGQMADPQAIPQMDAREISEWRFVPDWDALPQPLFVPYADVVKPEWLQGYKQKHNLDV